MWESLMGERQKGEEKKYGLIVLFIYMKSRKFYEGGGYIHFGRKYRPLSKVGGVYYSSFSSGGEKRLSISK